MVVSSFAQGADTTSLSTRTLVHSSLGETFVALPYENPAMKFYHHQMSLSNLSVSLDNQKESTPLIAEEGDGWRGFRVSADSYVRLTDNSRVWGEAYYRNGTRTHTQWSETSDYEQVYPYVVADSLCGDMKSETYYFHGGYAQHTGRWTYGLSFGYKALLEYRDVDPRPRNITADLDFRLGGTYALRNYALGLSGEVHRYKQNGNITYFDELGVSKTFQLTGLGTSYTRFDGARNSYSYEGMTYGATLSLLPLSGNGISGAAYFRSSSLTKKLPDPGNIKLNESSTAEYGAELAWKHADAHNAYGIKLEAACKDRTGTENFFGDAASNLYPLISSVDAFESNRQQAGLSLFYERHQTDCWRWSVVPAVDYRHRKDTYVSLDKLMEYSHVDVNLALNSSLRIKQNVVEGHVWCARQMKMDADLQTGTIAVNYARQMLLQNYRMQSAGCSLYGVSVRWMHTLKPKLGFTAELGWQQGFYNGMDEDNRQLWVSVGVSL